MHVNELLLTHFRNYSELKIPFHQGTHFFIGENAQGKTNILEALYVLALATSHRTNKDKELIRWGEEWAAVEGNVSKKYSSIPLQLHITQKGKKAKANRLEQRKLSDYIGILNVVMFAPEDLELVKGRPGARRRFMDMEIGQVHAAYLYYLSHYQKILSQRNALLKEWPKRKENRPLVDIFTLQLIEISSKILSRRAQFIQLIQQWAAPIHEQISKGKEKLEVEYIYSTSAKDEMNEEEIMEVLTSQFESIREQEEARGTTLIGPHRDDLLFKVNGVNVGHFGSQGQQRTTALSLKLAEIELIRSELGEYPILLLDDVLSELDEGRRSHLLEVMHSKVQTFVTSTSMEGIDLHSLDQATLYRVEEGQISQVREGL